MTAAASRGLGVFFYPPPGLENAFCVYVHGRTGYTRAYITQVHVCVRACARTWYMYGTYTCIRYMYVRVCCIFCRPSRGLASVSRWTREGGVPGFPLPPPSPPPRPRPPFPLPPSPLVPSHSLTALSTRNCFFILNPYGWALGWVFEGRLFFGIRLPVNQIRAYDLCLSKGGGGETSIESGHMICVLAGKGRRHDNQTPNGSIEVRRAWVNEWVSLLETTEFL